MNNDFCVGFIGFGAMSRLYARHFAHCRIIATDLPENLDKIRSDFPDVKVYDSPILVAREADYVIFSVDTKSLESLIRTVGPSIKLNAIVGGTTSVKEVEIEWLAKYVPSDVQIITFHSMHGPAVSPEQMPLVLIGYKCTPQHLSTVTALLKPLKSNIVPLSDGASHDKITADTQAVTHVAFMSMGLAWMRQSVYPWESKVYSGSIEQIKIDFMCRIFNSASHVYAGLAILNKSAHLQVSQYAESVNSLFRLMISEDMVALKERIYKAKTFVFKHTDKSKLLLHKDMVPSADTFLPNSHLSLLAIVDCWHNLGVSPYEHLICKTPPFVFWLGIVEYLFCDETLLEHALQTAVYDKRIRADDFAFCTSAQTWVQLIKTRSFEAYEAQFEEIKQFFGKDKLSQGFAASSKIIEQLASKS